VSDPMRQMLSMMRHHARAKTYLAVGSHLTLNGEDHVAPSLTVGRDKAIGSCGFTVGVDSPVQPVCNFEGKFLLAIEGRLRGTACDVHARTGPFKAVCSDHEVVSLFEDVVTDDDGITAVSASTAITRLRGGFSLAILDGRSITVSRDVIGVEPLYWGENDRYSGFASERKALWNIGITAVTAVPPGHVAVITNKTRIQRRAVALQRPTLVDISLGDAAQRLKTLLQRVVKAYLQDAGEVGVFFSGGVDSSLVAQCVIDQGVTPVLCVAGFEDAHDIDVAEQAAEELDCPLRETVISLDEAENYLRKVIYAVEEDDLMKISVGLPLYVAAEAAMRDGVGRVFAGQGADELFGGYARYCRILERRGAAELADALWTDVVHLADMNLQRDKGIALATNIDLVLPFVDLEVIHAASSFPTHLKVESSQDALRKPVLRETARLFGLSENITRRPKKAMQYGSGTHKAIQRLAKRRGYRRPSDYVASVFWDVFKELQ
jgi:asparagine synthase (glutamine-hydrolysing)